MNLLLKEYLSSGDKEEALRCLNELEVPHFHHELVYEAVVMVLEMSNVMCADMMSSLLQYMGKVMVITPEQFKQASSGNAQHNIMLFQLIFAEGQRKHCYCSMIVNV